MISKLSNALRRWGGIPEKYAAAQPLIAGYHRSTPRAWRALMMTVLAGACLGYGVAFGISAPARMMPFVVPIAILGGLILWSLPQGRYAPLGVIEPLFVAFFASLILWPNYLAVAILTLPWLTFLRIFGVPLMLAFLACISISARFRDRLREILSADKVILNFVAALACIWGGSILLSSDPGASLNRYILYMMNLILIFFVSCYLFSRSGFADFWVKAVLLMMGLLCLLGLWEFHLRDLPWAGHVPSFLKIGDPAVQRIITPGFSRGTEVYRVKGPATTPLGLSELLGLAMPFAIHILFNRNNLILRLLAALYLPLSIVVILLTDSRLGVVAACGAIMFYLLIWALLKWRQNKSSLLAPAIVLTYPATFAAFIASTFLVGKLRVEFWGTGTQQASTQGRLDQWASAIPKIMSHPLGHGVGQGADALGYANRGGVLTIDSYWLSVMLDVGPIGFFVFYGLMLRGAYRAARTAVDFGHDGELSLLIPFAVALINFVIIKAVLSQDANHPFIFMVLGAVVAFSYRAQQKRKEQTVALAA